ncbi:MAG TPA: YceI family protein [Flavitalea sp.]|nr:YceI family protein [Flavitalea sp.]
MKTLFLLGFSFLLTITAGAQDKYFTKSGKIRFYSKTDFETIDALNKSVTSVIDTKTGAIQFAVQMKGFDFKKAAMQEHFNEDYVESNKFPKAEFRGTITNNNTIDYKKDGEYAANVKGNLTLHGQTHEIETIGKVLVKNGKIAASADFILALADFKILVPTLVKDKISKTVNINVTCLMEPLK